MFSSRVPAWVIRVWGNSLALSPVLSILVMLLAGFTSLTYCWVLFIIMFCWGTVISIPGFVLFNLAVQAIDRRASTGKQRLYWCLAAGNVLWIVTYICVIYWGELRYADRLVSITLGSYLLTLSASIFYCRAGSAS